MANWEKLLASSLRVKVLVPTILVMAALLAITLFILNQVSRQQFAVNARENLRTADYGFNNAQINKRLELERLFTSISKAPRNRAAFRTLDSKTIGKQLELIYADEKLADDGVVVVFFTPVAQKAESNFENMVQQVGLRASPEQMRASCAPATASALVGTNGFDNVRVKDQIFSVVSIPIFYETGWNPHEVIGALTFGKLWDSDAVKKSFMTTGLNGCVAFIAGDQVSHASTLPGTNAADPNLVALFRRLVKKSGASMALEDVVMEQKHFYCTSGNFRSLSKDNSLGYLLFSKYQEQLDDLVRTQNQLVVASLLAMLGGVLLIMFFVSRALGPLQELRAGAEAVGRGDFSRRVIVRSADECGQLAKVFNRMTADVEHSQTQLKHTVDTLQTTQAQLIQSEKLSAIGEFVAGVAHELNNPLATVMGFSEILKSAPVEPKYQRHLMMIFKSAERCQKIVQSLLTFARRHQPERVPVAVNKLVEEVLEIVAYQLRTNNIEVIRAYAENLPPVLADGHQIQQVIINLVNNARQAIEAHQPAGQLIITTEADHENVRIKIADNGPGIADDNLRKIFDPFFTTKGVGKGTGLGLSLCYGLIKEHGGNISVASQPGQGATFIVELPIAVNVPAEFLPPPSEETHHTTFNPKVGAGKTILVIDDEEMLLTLADAELSAHGYAVITANNGEAALRELADKKVDAILCDLKMPGLNGRQVLERIRATHPALTRHFAFVTGDIINEPLAEFFETEKVRYLNKPFSLAELRGMVKSIS
jgi:two-component system, NtrC family, sensor kinase